MIKTIIIAASLALAAPAFAFSHKYCPTCDPIVSDPDTPSDCTWEEIPVQWRKEIIKRIDKDNWIILSNGECFKLDREQTKNWQVGDEVLLPEDRMEMINQTRGNTGADLPVGD